MCIQGEPGASNRLLPVKEKDEQHRSGFGIFCTVARTEMKEKFPDVTDEMLLFLNYAMRNAYDLGAASVPL